jgi:hypothetical protein
MNEQTIFLAVLDKDPAERAAFLDEAWWHKCLCR